MAFPSDDQRRVIEHRVGPLVVLAGPGSGKTSALLARMMRILDEDPDAPVTFITFTRMSRRDTARKLEEKFGARGVPEDDATLPTVATLHTFAKSIVHRGARHVGLQSEFSVLVPFREDDIVFDEAREDVGSDTAVEIIRRHMLMHRYLDGAVVTPDLPEQEAERVKLRVEELLRFYNAIDLPALVNHARHIIETDPSILGRSLPHIDEYQDLNAADQKLVDALRAAGGSDLVVVGDDDQSIYGYRQAMPDGIRKLMTRQGWTPIIFRECHRLPPHVFRASQALLRLQRKQGFDKRLIQPKDDGTRVPAYQCTRPEVEYRRVIKDIKERLAASEKTGRPYRPSDFMILSPHRAGLTDIAELLEAEGIPHRLRKRKNIPEDLWAFVLLLRMIRDDDHIALRQWLPRLGLSGTDITDMRRAAEGAGRSLFEYARGSDREALRNFLQVLERLRETRDRLNALVAIVREARVMPLSEALATGIQRATDACSRGGRVSVACLVRVLYEEFGLLDPEEETSDEDKVLLSTLHSAKGLEARVVYIIHLDDRFIPISGRDPDEEVRVLYVGLTRAKERLELSFSERFEINTRRYLKEAAASPFLRGIAGTLNIIRVTASDL